MIIQMEKDNSQQIEQKNLQKTTTEESSIELPEWDDENSKQILRDHFKIFSKEADNKKLIDITPEYYTKYGLTETTIKNALMDNEDGDADLFIHLFRDRYLYDHAEKIWYYWNDHYWREDKLNHVSRCIKDIIAIYDEQAQRHAWQADIDSSNGKKDEAAKHQSLFDQYQKRKNNLQTLVRKKSVLTISTQGKNSLGFTGENWDAKVNQVGVKNAVIDLEKGEADTSGTRQKDYIKTIAPTDWKGIEEPCPTWENFLQEIFKGREEYIGFLQRLFGYALRGDVREHIFPIFYGPDGRNGKSTMFEILKYVLGDLTVKIPSSFLIDYMGNNKNADAPSAITVSLRGAKIVWCAETKDGDRIDTSKLKENIGGDTLSARSPHAKKQIEITPTHTLFLMTNKKLRMPANDPALWRKIFLIEFIREFIDDPDPNNPNQAKADKQLKAKLKKEASGILAWLVKGAIFYQIQGLMPPQSIIEATNLYRDDEDIIGHFIKECCVIGDPESVAFREEAKNLYAAYKNWCDEVGHRPMAKKHFRQNLLSKFKEKPDGPLRKRKLFGITLIPDSYQII